MTDHQDEKTPSTEAARQAAVESSRLPDLIALAQEGSSDKRRQLLRDLTDHFFGMEPERPAVAEHYDVVLTQLSNEMETAVRAEIAARFASAPNAPLGLVRRLAEDKAAEVAEQVLSQSPVLQDDDLVRIVRQRSQAHMRAVSRRESVSEAVSEAIVEHGDDETLETLLRNDGARMSRATTETVVERAIANPALHEATVGRKSLPIDLLNEMYFVVEVRLRQQILETNASMDPDLLEAALAAGRARVAVDDGALPPDYTESLAYVKRLHKEGELGPQVIARFLRAKTRTSFLVALSVLTDMDFTMVRSIVERRDLDALAVICKASDLDRTLFLTYSVGLMDTSDNALGRAAAYGKMYAELSREAAMRTIRFWRMRRSAQAA